MLLVEPRGEGEGDGGLDPAARAREGDVVASGESTGYTPCTFEHSSSPSRSSAAVTRCPIRPTESDGIITNTLLLSSLRGTEPDVDTDVSIRPGERIESATVDRGRETDVNISGAGHLELLIDCINPASTPDNACQSAGTATEAGVDVVARYAPNTASREVGHNVLLLIDMSGSLSGIVNDVSFKEDRRPNPLPQNFGDIASDRTDVRLAAAQRLPRTLNARDNFGVIAFGQDLGENGRLVPCAAGDLSCFGPVDVEPGMRGSTV